MKFGFDSNHRTGKIGFYIIPQHEYNIITYIKSSNSNLAILKQFIVVYLGYKLEIKNPKIRKAPLFPSLGMRIIENTTKLTIDTDNEENKKPNKLINPMRMPK